MNLVKLPTTKQFIMLVLGLIIWLGVTAAFVGMRGEHIFLAILIAVLFTLNLDTRKLVVALIPFALFGISYDWMNLAHNYEVNPPVDIQGIYELEKSLFGIATPEGIVTPNEYFAVHNSHFVDFITGLFYLCWVPVPMLFGLWLYFKRQRKVYLHFAVVFLFVNIIGFCIYYIHPAAPPWYVACYGFDFHEVTGQVAGLQGFDDITGWKVFEGLYTRNSNIFAAVPSLHSAYTFLAFIYSLRGKCPLWLRITLGVITAGIWFTAVYSSHHYIIDVLAGITCALVGYFTFEYVLMKTKPVKKFMGAYLKFIS